jgi:hypothetical protein
MNTGPLDFLPLWALCLATIALGFLSVEAGYRLGRRLSSEPETEASVRTMVAATLGLLAFTLAFTFGLASSRFDARRQVVQDEANAIRTSHLRSAFLPEPQRSTIRGLLREYLEARLEAAQPGKAQQAVVGSQRLHARLWAEAVAAVEKEPSSVLAGLFIDSLNEIIDLHAKRVQATLRSRVPGVIWATLYFAASFSMAGIGYHLGLTSRRRSPAVVALVLTFSAVMFLIEDLDRPQEGLLRVSQQAMVDLRNSLGETNR